MADKTHKTNVIQLLSACISLAHFAGREIIRIYNNSKKINIFEKNDQFRLKCNKKLSFNPKISTNWKNGKNGEKCAKMAKNNENGEKYNENKINDEYDENDENDEKNENNEKYERYEKTQKIIDPQTEADVAAQNIITCGLENSFENLKIIAEEDQNLESQAKIFIPPSLDLVKSKPLYLNTEDLIVWVDPLDGTTDFIEGNLNGVTVLIGVSFKGKPILGVVAQPFNTTNTFETTFENKNTKLKKSKNLAKLKQNLAKNGQKSKNDDFFLIWALKYENFDLKSENLINIFKTKIQPKFLAAENLDNKNDKNNFKNELKRRILVSYRISRSKFYQNYVKKCLSSEILKEGGSGNKMLLLLEDLADAYVFPISGTKKWDTCAVQLILESVGGKLTNPDGISLDYSADKIENPDGFIGTIVVDHKSFIFGRKSI